MEKDVCLHRVKDTFGFAVFGGFQSTLPAVVCEVTSGGPAETSGRIFVGDVIRQINDVSLEDKKPDEVVQVIRSAPEASMFVLVEDQHYREKTMEYLRKREKKAMTRRRKKERSSAEGSTSTSSDISRDDRGHSETPSFSTSSTCDSLPSMEQLSSEQPVLDQPSCVVRNSIVSCEGSNCSEQCIEEELSRQPVSPVTKEMILVAKDARPGTSVQKSKSFNTSCRHDTRQAPPPADYAHRRKSWDSLDVRQQPLNNGDIPSFDGKQGNKLPQWNISSSSQHRLSSEGTHGNEVLAQPADIVKSTGELLEGDNPSEIAKGVDTPPISKSSSERSLLSSNETPDAEESEGRETPLVADGVTPLPDDDGRETPLVDEGTTPTAEEVPREFDRVHPPLKVTSDVRDQNNTHANADDIRPRNESVVSVSGITLSLSSDPLKMQIPGVRLTDLVESLDEEVSEIMSGSYLKPSVEASDGMPAKHRSLSSDTTLQEHQLAAELARKLYFLDGFKKEAVARHLSAKSSFGSTVAKEYLEHFSFEGASLDEAVRTFLSSFALVGESQEIDRIMDHFSQRFFEENPGILPAKDTVHAVVSAMLLLNSDLHREHSSGKMSCSAFITNVMQLEVPFPRNTKEFHKLLKTVYESVKHNAIEFVTDSNDKMEERGVSPSSDSDTSSLGGVRMYKVNVPGSFVEVELPGDAPVFREGQVMRKNIMEGPHKKVPRGHRGWKGYHAYLKGFLLYFCEPHSELRLEDTRSAMPIMNCLASSARDYNKRASVLRVTTSDWRVFLLQTSNMLEVQQWMLAINRSAAVYSSPPLATAVGSGTQGKFIRPMFPLRPTPNSMEEQAKSHATMIDSLDRDLVEHKSLKPSAGKPNASRSTDWFDKYEYLQYEIHRYRIYHVALTSDVDISQLNAPIPSVLMPSPSTLTLATANSDTWNRYRGPPSPTPSSASYRGSPLSRRKAYPKHLQ